MKAGTKVDSINIGSTKTQTASMQIRWFLAIVSTSLPIAVLMIILNQQKVLVTMERGEEMLPMKLETLGNQLVNLETSKVMLENLLAKGKKEMEDLEAEVAGPGPDIEKTKAEIDICEAEKETEAEELAAKEKERTETEANLKSESDAWNEEIRNLKAQAIGYRPMCDYVGNNTIAKELCGTKGETLA